MNKLFLENLAQTRFKMLDLSKWSKDSDKQQDEEEPESDEEEEEEDENLIFSRRQRRKANDLTKYMQYVTATD